MICNFAICRRLLFCHTIEHYLHLVPNLIFLVRQAGDVQMTRMAGGGDFVRGCKLAKAD